MLLAVTEPVAIQLCSALERVKLEDTHCHQLVRDRQVKTALLATLAGMVRQAGSMLNVQDHVRQADGPCHRQPLARQVKIALRATLGGTGL